VLFPQVVSELENYIERKIDIGELIHIHIVRVSAMKINVGWGRWVLWAMNHEEC
jgi:hypothetical protein